MDEILNFLENYLSAYVAGFLGGELLILPLIVLLKLEQVNFFMAMLAAVAGTLSRDWVLFLVFRKFGKRLLLKMPKIAKRVSMVDDYIFDHPPRFLFLYRLMIGFVIPVVITMGMSKLSIHRFAIISFISNSIFILVIGGLGYFFADVMLENILWLKEHWYVGFAGIILLIGLYQLITKRWAHLFEENA